MEFLIQLAIQITISYYTWLLTAPDGPRFQGSDTTKADFGEYLTLCFGEECPVGGKVLALGRLVEHEHEQDAGLLGDIMDTSLLSQFIEKPKYYTYTRSFGVHVADRLNDAPIEDVPEIWLNGRLVFRRSSTNATMTEQLDGDGNLIWRKWTANGGIWRSITIYGGGFDQVADPVLAAEIDDLQAFRGSAYVVFESLELTTGNFGNVLPATMRFLVTARTGQTLAHVIAAAATAAGLDPERDISTTAVSDVTIRGYFVDGGVNCWDAVAPLLPAYLCDLAEASGTLEASRRDQSVRAVIPAEHLAAHAWGDERPEDFRSTRQPDLGLPRTLTVTTLDPERDYQPNSYTSRRSGGDASSNVSRNISIVQTADERARLAETLHWEAWLGRQARDVAVSDDWNVRPGRIYGIETPQGARPYRVARKTRGDNGVNELMVTSHEGVIYRSTATGTVGDYTPAPEEVYGDTRLIAIDGPIIRNGDDDAGFYFVMAGEERTWSRGRVQISFDGEVFTDIVDSNAGATIGDVSGVLGDGPVDVYDDATTLTVVLADDITSLPSVSDAQLDLGRNLAAVGDPATGVWEYLQFGVATRVAAATWELTHLLRGRFGTDWATGEHGAAEVFVLLRDASLFRLNLGAGYWNQPLNLRAVSATQDEGDGVVTVFTNTGEGKRPYSPVNVVGERNDDLDLTITWNRRSRLRADTAFEEPPLGEETEEYEVDVWVGGVVVDTLTSSTETVSLTAAEQTGYGITPGDPVTVDVYQLSATRGRGRPRRAVV